MVIKILGDVGRYVISTISAGLPKEWQYLLLAPQEAIGERVIV
jgi:hypothetical protein